MSFVRASNRPAGEGRGGGSASVAREETSSHNSGKQISSRLADSSVPHGGWLSWERETNRAIEIRAVESPRNETRRSDVLRGRPADCCLPREGVPGGQYRADRSLLAGPAQPSAARSRRRNGEMGSSNDSLPILRRRSPAYVVLPELTCSV